MNDVVAPDEESEPTPPTEAQIKFIRAMSQYTDPLDGLEYYKDALFEGIDPDAADISTATNPETGVQEYSINENTSGTQVVRFLKNYATLINEHAEEWVFG